MSVALHLHLEWTWHFLKFALALTIVAFVGKFVGTALAVRLFGQNTKECIVVGFGMNGRGAIELILAALVLELSREMMNAGTLTEPLLTESQFSALILLAFITKFVAPLTMKWSVGRSCQPDEYANFCQLLEENPDR